MTNIVIVVRDGLIESVYSTDPDIMVDKIDFDTQDPEELELAEERLNELDDTYIDIY